MCPFKDAQQDSVDLGKFKDLSAALDEPSAHGGGGGGGGEVVMAFEGGAKCWNGPKRSLKLTFACGAVDELLDASEPDTCAYVATLATPAACG